MAALQFPYEAFLEARRRKSQGNIDGMNQLAEGGLSGLANLVQGQQKGKQFKEQQDAINQIFALMNSPQSDEGLLGKNPQDDQGNAIGTVLQQLRGQQPQTAGTGMSPMQSPSVIPPGQPMSAGPSNIGQDVQMPPSAPQITQQSQTGTPPPQSPFNGVDPRQLLALYSKANPQGAQELIGKYIQQQIGLGGGPKQTSPWRVIPGMISPNGKPIQQNEQTGEVREVDVSAIPTGRGNSAFQGKGSPTDTSKSNYFNARAKSAEVGALASIEKQIDPSSASKSTPIGAAASSIRRAINGLSLLQQPVVTKTALEATMGDIDSILTQAGATVEGRKMLSTPNALSNLASYRSFVSSAPDKVAVPPGMVNIYKNILKDLAPIQEKFVKDRVRQQGEFYRSLGESLVGKQKYDDFINRTINGFKVDLPGNSGDANNMGSSQGAYSDPSKEARYQAWKKGQGL